MMTTTPVHLYNHHGNGGKDADAALWCHSTVISHQAFYDKCEVDPIYNSKIALITNAQLAAQATLVLESGII